MVSRISIYLCNTISVVKQDNGVAGMSDLPSHTNVISLFWQRLFRLFAVIPLITPMMINNQLDLRNSNYEMLPKSIYFIQGIVLADIRCNVVDKLLISHARMPHIRLRWISWNNLHVAWTQIWHFSNWCGAISCHAPTLANMRSISFSAS